MKLHTHLAFAGLIAFTGNFHAQTRVLDPLITVEPNISRYDIKPNDTLNALLEIDDQGRVTKNARTNRR